MSKLLDMPKEIEAERAIFSIVLTESELINEVIDILKPSDFYSLAGQQIWRAILSVYEKGLDLDIVTLEDELQRSNASPQQAFQELRDCYENPVSSYNLSNFVLKVRNASLLRQIISLSIRSEQQAKLLDVKATDVLMGIEKETIALSEQVANVRATDAEGIIEEVERDLEAIALGGSYGFSTGFSLLDKRTGGFLPSQIWVLGANTGIGKSFVILQLALNVLKQKGKVMLFSTEMDRKLNMMRLIGNLAGVGTIRLVKGLLDEDEKLAVKEAVAELKSYRDDLVIYDSIYSVEEMRLKIKKQQLEKKVDLVIVDFLQNLTGPENIYERMSNAAIALQKIAQEQKITILLVSQVSQAAAGWQSKEAIEYKGAGEIAMIADVGLWMMKDKDIKDQRVIYLRKVRHGQTGCFNVKLSFPSGRVLEVGGEPVEDVNEKPKKESVDDGQIEF